MVPEVGGRDAQATEHSAAALAIAAGLLERFSPETVVSCRPRADRLGRVRGRRLAPCSGDLSRLAAQVAGHTG